MNKIVNINLGGYPFVIDDHAYSELKNYLDALSRHFRASEGFEEIITDIENRIAELLNENLGNRQIVTIKDIEEIKQIMGSPQEFAGEEREEWSRDNPTYRYKTGKKLFRNTDDKAVAGVCSGLASYFGIDDPIWVRVGFALFTIGGGIGVAIYAILWALTPEAKTAADKLAMRGEPINVSNIAKSVENELDNLSETLSDIGQQFGSKKKSSGRKDRDKKHH